MCIPLPWGDPSKPDIAFKGLPEPYVKRTVEGDLGLRYSAVSLYRNGGAKMVRRHTNLSDNELRPILNNLTNSPEQLPENNLGEIVDCALAKTAVELAVERHVGYIETFHTPFGCSYTQYGKDLTNVCFLVGTGGILAHCRNPLEILTKALFDKAKPTVLKPMQPRFLLDKHYIMAAMGLLSEVRPNIAFRILIKYLIEIQEV